VGIGNSTRNTLELAALKSQVRYVLASRLLSLLRGAFGPMSIDASLDSALPTTPCLFFARRYQIIFEIERIPSISQFAIGRS